MKSEDNTVKTDERKILDLIISSLEEFLQFEKNEPDYQKLADNIRYIAGAKYACLDLYDEKGTTFTAAALSAPKSLIKEVSSLLGYKLLGKKWKHDTVLAGKIKNSTITHFSNLFELAGEKISQHALNIFEKIIGTGQISVVKILNRDMLIGLFILLMPENTEIKNEDYIEIYARQLGLFIDLKRGRDRLGESEERFKNLFNSIQTPFFLFDQETGSILDANFSACSLYGYSRDKMLSLKAADISAEAEKTLKTIKKLEPFISSSLHKKKDGTLFPAEINQNNYDLNGKKIVISSIRDITEQKKTEDMLFEEREKLENLLEGTNVGTWEWNIEKGEITLNSITAEFLGYTLDEISPVRIEDWEKFVHPDDLIEANEKLTKVFSRETDYFHAEARLRHKDGSWVWELDRGKVTSWTREGKPHIMKGLYIDITDRKKAEELLRQSEERYRDLIDNSHDIIYTINPENGVFKFVSKSWTKLLGHDISEAEGNPFQKFIHPDDISKCEAFLDKVVRTGEPQTGIEYRIKHADGTWRWHTSNAVALRDMEGRIAGYEGISRDITDRKKLDKKILYLSFHDQLTGLYNRRFFEEELSRLDTERQLPLSFIMGDLNGLKIINDVFGHSEGDKRLKETAEILKRVCRSDDILARWGGDEFVILLPRTSSAEAEEIIQRIKKECKKTSANRMPVSISLGASQKEYLDQDTQSVVMDAESNMYKNKLVEKESLASSIIFALDQALYEKSNETKAHTDRIRELAMKLGKAISLSSSQLDELSLLISLHDIGKVAIPEKILLKKGELTEKEREIINRHPEIGFNIARSSQQISHIAKYILSCHENWDGSGYPLKLKGDAIPVISRITFIADSYEVMTGGRIYKDPVSRKEAIEKLREGAGKQFDPLLVNKFIEIIES